MKRHYDIRHRDGHDYDPEEVINSGNVELHFS